MNKPWYQSVAILGGTAYAMLQAAETVGFVPAGTGVEIAKIGSGLTSVYGLRRSMDLTKPLYQSVTMIGGVALAGVQALETFGAVPAGAGAQLGQIAAGLVTLYGLRRAAG